MRFEIDRTPESTSDERCRCGCGQRHYTHPGAAVYADEQIVLRIDPNISPSLREKVIRALKNAQFNFPLPPDEDDPE